MGDVPTFDVADVFPEDERPQPPADSHVVDLPLERRIRTLQNARRHDAARIEQLEFEVIDLHDRYDNLNHGLGLAFLLIAAVCWALILAKPDA